MRIPFKVGNFVIAAYAFSEVEKEISTRGKKKFRIEGFWNQQIVSFGEVEVFCREARISVWKQEQLLSHIMEILDNS